MCRCTKATMGGRAWKTFPVFCPSWRFLAAASQEHKKVEWIHIETNYRCWWDVSKEREKQTKVFFLRETEHFVLPLVECNWQQHPKNSWQLDWRLSEHKQYGNGWRVKTSTALRQLAYSTQGFGHLHSRTGARSLFSTFRYNHGS